MRPEDKWVKQPRKDQGDRRKRVRNKKAAADGAPTPSESGQTEREASAADQPTPSDTAEGETPRDEVDDHPNESTSKKPRASSAEPERRQHQPTSAMDKSAAEAALRRAIQSSPVRLIGTPVKPVDVDSFGATRRLLFPSPRNEGHQKGLEDGVLQDSTTKQRPRSSDGPSPSKTVSSDIHNKENHPPTRRDKEFDNTSTSFEGHLPSTPPRRSPSRSSLSSPNAFKTPLRSTSKSIAKQDPASARSGLSSLFSSAAKPQTYEADTPERHTALNANSHPASPQYTPFTTQLHQMLSEVNVSPSAPNHHSHDFEMPDLEDLLHPRHREFELDALLLKAETRHAQGQDEDYSQDLLLPSSPPYVGRGLFALYEDPVGSEGGLWSEYIERGGP
jgi:hypothetical protein